MLMCLPGNVIDPGGYYDIFSEPLFDDMPTLVTPTASPSLSASQLSPVMAEPVSRKRKQSEKTKEQLLEEIEVRKRKNVESAQRSRKRKQAETEQLKQDVFNLQLERDGLKAQNALLLSEQANLRERLAKLEALLSKGKN
ncbi:hypothetical protein EDD86DRAFT_244201 [Gorgonomyces haynaldii]|nr:hypothetical protein EDD86DRAFT_244201 [Gorgonomyces haynaldii]